MNCPNLTRLVDGKRYSVSKSTIIASDCYWDGNNMERGGRNTFLLKTQRGNYFLVNVTQWQGEQDTLSPVSEDDAAHMYEELPEHEVDFEEAFPNRIVEEA